MQITRRPSVRFVLAVLAGHFFKGLVFGGTVPGA